MTQVIPSKRIDRDGNERDMESPYELGGYYCTIGLTVAENPFLPSDKFNHRRFVKGFVARKAGKS